MTLGPDSHGPQARAVSDTVAFVLVFSLVVTSAGIVATAGFGSLQDVQRSQQADLSTGTLRAIGGEIDGIARGTRPAYRDSIELGGGRITLVDETTVTVTLTNTTGTVFDETYRPRALTYAYEGRNTSYESGILARGSRQGRAVLVSEPATMRCVPTSDTAMLSIVQLVSGEGDAVSGGPVTVEARRMGPPPPTNVTHLEYPTTRPAPNATKVTLSITGPRRAAWSDALAAQGFTATGGSMTCNASQVTVRLVRVEIDLLA